MTKKMLYLFLELEPDLSLHEYVLKVQEPGPVPGQGPECDGHHLPGDSALSHSRRQVSNLLRLII